MESPEIKKHEFDRNDRHFWVTIFAMVAQAGIMMFYLGQQTQAVKEELSTVKRDVQRLESYQQTLLQLVKDVAILDVRSVETAKKLERLENLRGVK